MNAITKSGTNGIHGSAFEFLRNDYFDARNFLDPTKAELRQNQFGYGVGGPFWKNRIFWFTDYQNFSECFPTTFDKLSENCGNPAGPEGMMPSVPRPVTKPRDERLAKLPAGW